MTKFEIGATPEGRSSFLKKRTKKLLLPLSRVPPEESATALAKVFCFFFTKKKNP
jgi:hypothetical protein